MAKKIRSESTKGGGNGSGKGGGKKLDTNLDPLNSETDPLAVDPLSVETDPLAVDTSSVETEQTAVEPLSVTTDKADYAPGETALFTVTGVTVGGTVSFDLADDPADPGDDGDADIYPSFTIVDGGEGDGDGEANGSITAEWFVPTNGDPNNATLNLTATDWGLDGLVGSEDDRTAATTFTDAPIQHHVWDPSPAVFDWVGGNAKGYSEGETAAFWIVVPDAAEGDTIFITIQLDWFDGSAYAFTALEPWDTTYQQDPDNPADGDLASPPAPFVDDLTGEMDGVNASGATVVDVSDPTSPANMSYLEWRVELLVDTVGGVIDGDTVDVSIVYGGHLAAPEEDADPGDGVIIIGPDEGASNISGVFQARLDPPKTINFQGQDIAPAADPIIVIEKSTNGEDADSPTGPYLAVGSTANFTYTVTNTGNVALDVDVTDDNGTPGDTSDDFNPSFTGGDTNGDGFLDTDETWTYEASTTVTAGQYTNIATASGADANGSGASDDDSDPSNHFGSLALIDIEKSTNGDDADTATGPHLPVGSTANFTYTVTNTGNVALDVDVTDDNGTPGDTSDDFNPSFTGGDTNGDGFLDTDETWTYEASTTVTAGQYTNIATASGADANGSGASDDDSDPSNHFGSLALIDIEKSTNGDDADTATGPYLPVGSTANFTYTVTNTGNVALDVDVTDDNGTPGDTSDDFNPSFTGGDTNGDGFLDTDETWTYEASTTVTAGQYTNIATASGADANGSGASDDDSDPSNHFGSLALIDIEKSTNGDDADTATGPYLPVGSTANFTYTVTNTGNVALDVDVTDDNGTPGDTSDDFNPSFTGGDTNGDGFLDTDETWTYEASTTVTAGQYTNIATASGADANGSGASDDDSDPSNHFGSLALIDIEKSTNGDDADTATGPYLPVGSTANFTYTVTNTGNVALDVDVTDDNGTPGDTSDDFNPSFTGGDTNGDGFLDTDETWTYEASTTVTAGQYTNIATASGADANGSGASDDDSDPSNHFGSLALIDIEKSTNGDDADTATGPYLPVGSTANFTYTVTNTGNVALDVDVTDDNGTPGDTSDDFNPSFTGGDTNGDGFLDTDETWTYEASTTVTAGQYTNIATASGADANGSGASDDDSDPSNHFGSLALIDIEKSTNGDDADTATGPYLPVGSTANFTYTVTNTGNVALDVDVTDDNGTPGDTSDDFNPSFTGGDTNGDGFLDTDETWTYEASTTVTAGQYTNIATASGADANGSGASDDDSDPSNHFGSLALIDIEKSTNGDDADTATGPYLPVGSTANFTYTVTNTGNVALDVDVTDDNGTPGDTSDDFNPSFTGGDTNGDGFLDTDETWTYEASTTVTAGQYTNIATASGADANGSGASDDDSDPSNHFGSLALIDIEKSTNGDDADTATGPYLPVGSTANFTYTVTNTGNVALDVDVTDDNGTPGDTSDDFNPSFTGGDTNGDGFLDTDETWTYEASTTVTAGQYTNIATASGADANGSGASDDDSDPSNHFGSLALIDIEKSTNGDDADTATGPYLPVGSTANFTYTVTNTGNVALDVDVTDDNGTPGDTSDDFNPSFTGGDTNGDGFLDTDETWTYEASTTVTAGQYTNIATASGADANGSGASDDDSDPSNHFGSLALIDIEKSTNGDDADTATGPYLPVGSTANFTYTVTNTGNVALDVDVTDDNGTPGDTSDDFNPSFTGGDTNGDGFLDTDETWTYEASTTVTAGQYTNIATASGADANGSGASDDDSDPSNHFGSLALIDIEKSTNGDDADTATGPYLPVGSTANFTYTVTNTGNVALDVDVTDDNGTPGDTSDDFNPSFTGGDTNGDGFLDTDETWTYEASTTVTAGQYTNIATASGADANGSGASDDDSDPSNHFGSLALIDIEKSTNGDDADTATGPYLPVGSTANFTYTVTNTGNVALDVDVTDDNGTPGDTSDDFNPSFTGGDTNGDGFLDTDETWTYEASTTVTAGQYTNIATASGADANGSGASDDDSDPSNHFGSLALIDIEKSTNGDDADTATGPYLPVGSTANFTYTVTNTGNVALDVDVTDDNGTPGDTSDDFNPSFTGGDTNGDGFLDTDETWTYEASTTVTAGQYTNIATASGADANGSGASDDDSDPSNHFGSLALIDIEKSTNGDDADTATGPYLPVGSTANFTYTVTNTGNVALDVDVTDDNGTPGDTSDDFNPSFTGGDTNGDGFLDTDETWTYEASTTVTAGQYTNIATASGADANGSGASDDDSDPSNHFGAEPSISLDKSIVSVRNANGSLDSDGVVDAAGDVIRYQLKVTNDGSTDLTDVKVKDFFEDEAKVLWEWDSDSEEWTGPGTITESGDDDGMLEAGEMLTITYDRTVTQSDLDAARDIQVELQKIGFVWCAVQECTGDLDLDNYAEVTAQFGDEELEAADYESVDVTCPSGCVDGNGSSNGGSNAESLWQAWLDAPAQEAIG